jgi:DNA polymerase-1
LHSRLYNAERCAGRLASSNPNMQSVPAHDDRGRIFRSAFTADEGHLLVSADYSQVSTRMG